MLSALRPYPHRVCALHCNQPFSKGRWQSTLFQLDALILRLALNLGLGFLRNVTLFVTGKFPLGRRRTAFFHFVIIHYRKIRICRPPNPSPRRPRARARHCCRLGLSWRSGWSIVPEEHRQIRQRELRLGLQRLDRSSWCQLWPEGPVNRITTGEGCCWTSFSWRMRVELMCIWGNWERTGVVDTRKTITCQASECKLCKT